MRNRSLIIEISVGICFTRKERERLRGIEQRRLSWLKLLEPGSAGTLLNYSKNG